jgi:hypothetical protein
MTKLAAFSWGYWGWGNHTKELLREVDAIEKDRGWQPPIFVDIRFQRASRAVGFRGANFERLLGRRYCWIKGLGNRSIASGGKSIEIADPRQAEELLEKIIEARKERRRLIFYCACQWHSTCHRSVVAALVVKAARQRGRTLTVTEWLGEQPVTQVLDVEHKVVRQVEKGGGRVPLPAMAPKRRRAYSALPLGSRVRLRSEEGELMMLSGPARLGKDGWFLPVLDWQPIRRTDPPGAAREAAGIGYWCGLRTYRS